MSTRQRPGNLKPDYEEKGGTTMTMARMIYLPILFGIALSACQSSQSRQAELARICADPANRQPGNFYSVECQSLYPLTNRQRQQNYLLGAPTGD